MSEGVWIALIALVQAVTLAVVGKIGRDSGITRREVKNSHKTNLREDLDAQHDEQMSELRGVRRDIGRLDTRDIERGRDLRALAERFEKHLEVADRERERVDEIEHTLNPRKDTP